MLSAEVEAALQQRPDLRVVKLADAARDNWSFLGQLAPQAASSKELVDFFHAAEQLKAATDAAYGDTDAHGRAQYEKHRHVLRHEHGGVERVIRALRYLRGKHPRRKRIKEVLRYFCRNRKRMDYAGAAQRGTADRFRSSRSRVQDTGHRTHEALGDAAGDRTTAKRS